jgi:hypothetical protein
LINLTEPLESLALRVCVPDYGKPNCHKAGRTGSNSPSCSLRHLIGRSTKSTEPTNTG